MKVGDFRRKLRIHKQAKYVSVLKQDTYVTTWEENRKYSRFFSPEFSTKNEPMGKKLPLIPQRLFSELCRSFQLPGKNRLRI
jgi:hypothetical protein